MAQVSDFYKQMSQVASTAAVTSRAMRVFFSLLLLSPSSILLLTSTAFLAII